MARKPIIHMQLVDENIPIDVSLYRAIKYSRIRPRDLKSAQDALKSQIAAVTSPNYQVDNPVTRTRGIIALEQKATSGEKVMLDEIREIRSRLSRLESVPRSASDGPIAPTTILTFTWKKELNDELAHDILMAMSRKFGMATMLARGSTNLTVLVTGDIDPNFFLLPEGLPKDLKVRFEQNRGRYTPTLSISRVVPIRAATKSLILPERDVPTGTSVSASRASR
jgi:hypothetical protein